MNKSGLHTQLVSIRPPHISGDAIGPLLPIIISMSLNSPGTGLMA